MTPRIAVVGGGISGLAAAYRLVQKGFRVTLFEATDRTGGVIRSERIGGYLVEHGPNSLQDSALFENLIDELHLGAARIDANPAAKNRYVVKNGQPVPLPLSPPAFLRSRLFSMRAKMRLLREPFVRPAAPGAEESVADFVRRRLGTEFLDYAVNPFVAGIFAGDPERLSLRHAFPRLFNLEQEYGSLIRGQIKKAREGRPQRASAAGPRQIFSFRSGLQTLPDALAERLRDSIQLQAEVVALEHTGPAWNLRLRRGHEMHEPFDAVLLTVPLYRLATFDLDADTALTSLAQVRYAPVSVLALGFRKTDIKHPLDGFGLLVPNVEPFRILGTLFSSSAFPGRAPEGHVLLTTFMGGMRDETLARQPARTLAEIAQQDLARLLGLTGSPTFVKHIYWPSAIPQYELGYGRMKAQMDALEAKHTGLFLAGSHRSGIAVGDALQSGFQAAERLMDWMNRVAG